MRRMFGRRVQGSMFGCGTKCSIMSGNNWLLLSDGDARQTTKITIAFHRKQVTSRTPAVRPFPATRHWPVITLCRNLRNILNRPVNHRGGISALLSPKVDSAQNATMSEAGGS